MKEKNSTMKMGARILTILFFVAFIAYVAFKVTFIDYDSAITFYKIYRAVSINGTSLIDICGYKTTFDTWANFIAYSLFGLSDETVGMKYALFTILPSLMAFLLVYKSKEKENTMWSICILFFLLFPNAYSNIYHLNAAAIVLLGLFLIDRFIHTHNKQFFFIGLPLWGLVFYLSRTELLLVLATLAIPYFIYYVIDMWQNNKKKEVVVGISILLLISSLIRVSFSVLSKLGINAFQRKKIYGDHISWASLHDALTGGKEIFLHIVSSFWGLPNGERMISLSSVYYLIKYIFLILACIIFLKKTIDIFRNGIKNQEQIEAVMVISTWLILFINIFNKEGIDGYQEWGYVKWTNRYMVTVFYFVPILMCRELVRKVNFGEIKVFRKLTVPVSVFISLAMIAITFMQYIDYPNDRRHLDFDVWAEFADALKDNNLSEGIAYEHSNMNNVDLWSDGQIHTVPVWGSRINNSIVTENANNDLNEGYRQLNFVIVRTKLEDYYNEAEMMDYDTREDVYNWKSHEKAGTIYMFDHDVRWDTQYIEHVSEKMMLPIEFGTTRITLRGENLPIDSLSFLADQKIKIESELYEDKVTYEIIAPFSTTIEVSNNSEYAFEVDRIYAAIKLNEDAFELQGQEEKKIGIELKPGAYYFTVCGKQINQLDCTFSQNGIDIEKVDGGTERRRYKLEVKDEDATIDIALKNIDEKNIYISSITYEEELKLTE